MFTISGGGKYYIAGIAPIELGADIVTGGGGGSSFIGRANLGYGVALADNINFEPAAGVLIAENSTAGVLQFSFVMFL